MLPEWPRSLGAPLASGLLRSSIEDFKVEELALLPPSGEGSHMWLLVQKSGANTDWVAGQLARAAGCSARNVGYAGMKDRHAVTTQWFSIPVPPGEEARWNEWVIPDVIILQGVRHQKKLKRGVLKGNRFTIVIRNLQGDLEELNQRLEHVRTRGVPNYFGPQRFGHGGDNVWRGARMLIEGGRLPRAKRSIYLSAVRSFLFNQVLAERVKQNTWDSLLDGEVVVLNGTRSVFLCDQSDVELPRRCHDFDIHPTGPLPGDAGFEAHSDAAALEHAVLEPYRELIAALRSARVEADRRSLRLRVTELEWNIDAGCLELRFALPPGAYATTVIDELVETANAHIAPGRTGN